MSEVKHSPLRIGLAGFGTVGSGLVSILTKNSANTMARTGREITISAVLVRDKSKHRDTPFPEGAVITNSFDEFISMDSIDVVVEVIGGIETAFSLIKKALLAGKHVVTANKALLAETGSELFKLAAEKNLYLGYEASVCGGIPIIETLKNGLIANTLYSIVGILNGTSNYILSEMTTNGSSFEEALHSAQKKGFAEADPTFDIDGIDAGHKLALLIRLGWGIEIPFNKISIQGIRSVAAADVEYAKIFGYSIKLIAQAKMQKGKIEAAVFPALVHETFLLSKVNGAYNAVRLHGDAVGSIFMHGLGAGDLPTGSAIVADIFAIARENKAINTGFVYPQFPTIAEPLSHDECFSPFYIRMQVTDAPGVMRDVAAIMAENNISIAQAIQKREPDEQDSTGVSFTIMTHKAAIRDVEKALATLSSLPLVIETPAFYRVLTKE